MGSMSYSAQNEHRTVPQVGVPMTLPEGSEHDITIILRVVLALSEDDSEFLVNDGEAYEVLARRLAMLSRNIKDVAARIREVTGYV